MAGRHAAAPSGKKPVVIVVIIVIAAALIAGGVIFFLNMNKSRDGKITLDDLEFKDNIKEFKI